MEQINEVRSLIVLGNGFDKKCGLPSSFQNFFKSIDKDTVHEGIENLYTFFESEVTKLPGFSANPGYRDQRLNFSEYIWFELHKDSSVERPELENGLDSLDSFLSELKSLGFWTGCFIIFCSNSKYWYNVEGFINDFFVKKSRSYGGKKSFSVDPEETRFSAIDKYIKDLKRVDTISTFRSNEETDLITKKLAFLLLNVFDYDSDIDLSEFLLDQLKIFEGLFDSYLTNQMSDRLYYKTETGDRLEELSDGEPYNLLNFNYTRVESKNMNIRRNIHSTLQHGPIIGIDSDKIFADARIYKFTKTYRIMKLAMEKNNSELIPSSIDKIIFYGHSLAQADYSYFQSIFDRCNIYQNNITLVFYYSTYDGCDEEQATRTTFDRVSQLLDNYGKTIPNHGKNLLSKMLLENRIKIRQL